MSFALDIYMFEIQDFINFNASGRAYCPSCSREKGRRPSQKSLALLDSGAYKCHAGCTPKEIRDSIGAEKAVVHQVNSDPPLVYFPNQLQATTDWLLNGNDGKRGQAQQWLKERGLTTELIQHYRLGLVTHHGRAGIVIPIPADDQGTRYYRKIRVEPWSDRPTWSQKGMPVMVYFTLWCMYL